MHGEIELKRDVDAVQIPSGTPVRLAKGAKVAVVQSLGGSHTVTCHVGLARVAEKDADALGIEPKAKPADGPEAGEAAPDGEVDEARIWEKLKQVYDPEIPVNVVDLGLIYSLMTEKKEGGGVKALVKMTLTAPGCGMGPTIAADARERVLTVPGVKEAEVELVWDPPWNQGMISEAGKMKLGLV